ncbi:polysaccharide lyase [Pseudothauera rhizosphaerae]|uniref:Polysaccharide lyase 14 domain-containing protein n=1 Tax=Pseudothauera rhizosphaerae TaxID=2565932 RepID=A0A4S4APK0_9RHOO|nr:hypothetical protein [Pseudothauera rhizosphaerae]THF61624.1 hypothetical protein E6O51_09215 [Pseudothauera rhizosphaerae]
MMSRAPVLASLLALLPVAAAAQAPISDALDGMTCGAFVSAAHMAWQRKGGDWVDADSKPFGTVAYAETYVASGAVGQTVRIDVTRLARAWMQGTEPVGAVFLAVPPGGESGRARFHSRESADRGARPKLVLRQAGGRTSEFEPTADSTLNCTTTKSLGTAKTITVGPDSNAILALPFPREGLAGIEQAELVLTVQKQYGGGAMVALYRPLLPRAEKQEVEPGLSRAYPGDRGIAGHPAVVFAESFEDDGWKSRLSSVTRTSHAALSGSAREGRFEPFDGRALKVTVPKGSLLGLNALYRFKEKTGQEPEEMYFRYALRFGDDWDPHISGGKMPGFAGTYNRGGWGGRHADGTNGWSARGTFFQARDHGSAVSRLRGIGSYVYHADKKSGYGATWGWNLGPTGALEKNRWYSVEQYVRMNTPGRKDGVLRAWIDGRLAFERTDLRFRDVPDLRIETLWLNVYHGGTKPTPQEMSLYIDNLVIAREYIGPPRHP